MNSIRLTQEQLYVTSKIGYVDCDAKFRSDIQLLFISGQHFLENIRASLPKRPGPHIHERRQRSCLQPANTTFATPMATISHSHIQKCLNLATFISLRQIAAKIPSQLHNSFLPSFLPSYETCSINVNPLFHAANKTIQKPYGILVLLSPLFSHNITTRNHIFLRESFYFLFYFSSK